MTVSSLTTERLLKMEAAGGLLTDALVPVELPAGADLHDWLVMFPHVNTRLVARWYDLRKAKAAMQAEIDRLTNS